MGLLDDGQEYLRRSGRNLGGLFDWLSGGAQAGAEPTMALMRGDALDQPLLPTADSGGRIGAVASAVGSTAMPVKAPAGALGAGPVMRGTDVALDMSPEARAARAAMQGYNLDAYHGTKSDFPAFQTQRTADRPNPDAFIHVGDQEAANGVIIRDHTREYYENLAANSPDEWQRRSAQGVLDDHYKKARVLPLKVKARNPLDMPDLGRWDSHSNFMSYAAKEKGWGKGYEPKGWEPSPEVWGDFQGLVERVRKLDYGEQKSAWQDGFADILKKHGYDSVRYPNEIEGKGGYSYMLLDPSQARSRFAEFHPDKVGDPNLLSSRGGGVPLPNRSEKRGLLLSDLQDLL